MSITRTLECYLKDQCIQYRLVSHPHTASSMATAEAAHVPGGRLAKAVVIRLERRFLLVVVPSDHHVDLDRLQDYLGETPRLATETELAGLFPDCEPGAVPPIGVAYEIRTLVDRQLIGRPQVYFEAGDHEHLIEISDGQFALLMEGAEEVDVGRHL